MGLLWGYVCYGQDTLERPVIDTGILTMKKEIYHIGAWGYGIEIQCENLFVRDDVLYLVFSVHNDSALSYEFSMPWFAIESRRGTRRRGVRFEKAIFPKQAYGLEPVPPGGEGRLVFTFEKMSLLRGQVFKVYFYERGGMRNLTLTLSQRDVNYVSRRISCLLNPSPSNIGPRNFICFSRRFPLL